MTEEQFSKLISIGKAINTNAIHTNTKLNEIKIILEKILAKLGDDNSL